jgi:hypothetical protein
MLFPVKQNRQGFVELPQDFPGPKSVWSAARSTHLFEGPDMMTDTDWMMHAKATRSMASRSLRHGDTEVAQQLFQAASRMETCAAAAAAVMSPGSKVVKLMAEIR